MNFLADESVDQPIVDRLRRDGHTVLAVVELEPSIPDGRGAGSGKRRRGYTADSR
jgi:uncharacterized protein DUF5615